MPDKIDELSKVTVVGLTPASPRPVTDKSDLILKLELVVIESVMSRAKYVIVPAPDIVLMLPVILMVPPVAVKELLMV